jgi:hypothetical protein
MLDSGLDGSPAQISQARSQGFSGPEMLDSWLDGFSAQIRQALTHLFSGLLGPLGAILGPLGALWGHSRGLFGDLGDVLGSLGLSLFRGSFGNSWSILGRSLVHSCFRVGRGGGLQDTMRFRQSVSR